MLHLRFSMRTFERRIRSADEADVLALEWQRAHLDIPDAFGGPSRLAEVDVAWHERMVFLRATQHLQKREFEEIFGFHVGGFVPGRVVSLREDVLTLS